MIGKIADKREAGLTNARTKEIAVRKRAESARTSVTASRKKSGTALEAIRARGSTAITMTRTTSSDCC
jgi:hypothetical protein